MVKDVLKRDLLETLSVSELPDILNACLDEAIELSINSTINSVPLYESIPEEQFLKHVLKAWKRYFESSRHMSFQSSPSSSIRFRGALLNHPHEKWEQLQLQLNQLISQYLD